MRACVRVCVWEGGRGGREGGVGRRGEGGMAWQGRGEEGRGEASKGKEKRETAEHNEQEQRGRQEEEENIDGVVCNEHVPLDCMFM